MQDLFSNFFKNDAPKGEPEPDNREGRIKGKKKGGFIRPS